MKVKMTWTSEEEAVLTVSRFHKKLCRMKLFDMGQDEAELRVDQLYEKANFVISKNEIEKKVTYEMINILKSVRTELRRLAYSSVTLITEKDSSLNNIIDSTQVVQLSYSEFMLQKHVDSSFSLNQSEPFEPLHLLFSCNESENDWESNNQETCSCGSEDVSKNSSIYNDAYRIHDFLCRGFLDNNNNDINPDFICRLSPYRDGWYLYEVEVKEELRGKGIGTAAMKQLLLQLSQRKEFGNGKAFPLYLQVGSYNEVALHLYQKLGFTVATELCYYQLV